jgi:hypothetical protein
MSPDQPETTMNQAMQPGVLARCKAPVLLIR